MQVILKPVGCGWTTSLYFNIFVNYNLSVLITSYYNINALITSYNSVTVTPNNLLSVNVLGSKSKRTIYMNLLYKTKTWEYGMKKR